jgi:hypothetical protein
LTLGISKELMTYVKLRTRPLILNVILLNLISFPGLAQIGTTTELRFDTVGIYGHNRLSRNFELLLWELQNLVWNGYLPAYDSPACINKYSKEEASERGVKRTVETISVPYADYSGTADTTIVATGRKPTIALVAAYKGENAEPWSLTLLYDSSRSVDDEYIWHKSKTLVSFYSIKFSELKEHFRAADADLIAAYLGSKCASDSAVTDTIDFKDTRSGLAFHRVFLKLDSLARKRTLKPYANCFLDVYIEVSGILIPRNVNMVAKSYFGEDTMQSKPYDSLWYFPYPAEEVKYIVLTYENCGPQGLPYNTPRPFSLCMLREFRPEIKQYPWSYCLDYEEIKKVLTKKEMQIVENYVKKSHEKGH